MKGGAGGRMHRFELTCPFTYSYAPLITLLLAATHIFRHLEDRQSFAVHKTIFASLLTEVCAGEMAVILAIRRDQAGC